MFGNVIHCACFLTAFSPSLEGNLSFPQHNYGPVIAKKGCVTCLPPSLRVWLRELFIMCPQQLCKVGQNLAAWLPSSTTSKILHSGLCGRVEVSRIQRALHMFTWGGMKLRAHSPRNQEKQCFFFPDENAGKLSTLSQQFIKKSNSPCSLCDYDCIILSEWSAATHLEKKRGFHTLRLSKDWYSALFWSRLKHIFYINSLATLLSL